MISLDTNVLVYSLDRHEPAKQSKARQLLLALGQGANATVLPWQVIGEFVQQMRRQRDKGRISHAEFLQNVAIFRAQFPLVLPRPAILDHAINLTIQFSLSHWDSMLLGACLDSGITKLYTEDMGAPRIIAGIELINPFV